MKVECGIAHKYTSVPARTRPENDGDWAKRSLRHMAAVLEGRGEGDDIDLVAAALQRHGYLERLVEAERFQPVAKKFAKAVVAKVQSHWSALHSGPRLGPTGAHPLTDGDAHSPPL